MNEFELKIPSGEDVEYSLELTPEYTGQRLAASETMMAMCSFGNMVFWNHKGKGFNIWKSIYDIGRNIKMTGGASQSVIELSIINEGSFNIDWKNLTKETLATRKIEMYYSPSVDNQATFRKNSLITTFDIHFELSMLEMYSGQFPMLDRFIENVHARKPAKLFNDLQFSGTKIDNVVSEIMSFSFYDSRADRYFDSYINIILILLLEKISGFVPSGRKFSPADIENAYQARMILTNEKLTEKDEAYTIEKLCRRLGTNPYKLKTTFKHVFGMSIGRFKQKVFMEFAYQMVESGNHSFDEIAMMLGYGTQQSFTTAFKNYFKRTPGSVRKHRR